MRVSQDVDDFSRRVRAQFVAKCKLCDGLNASCECGQKGLFYAKLYEACIPRDFWELETKDIKFNRKIYKRVIDKYNSKLDLALRHGYGLFLSGDNGVGKTTFLCLTLKAAILKGYSVYYTTLPDLVYNLSKGFRDQMFARRIEWYLSSDFLAIDEIGKDKIKNKIFAAEFHFERILKKRFDGSFPTLLASNMSPKETRDAYGKTVHSMLLGKYQAIMMKQGDFRSELRKRMHDTMGYDD